MNFVIKHILILITCVFANHVNNIICLGSSTKRLDNYKEIVKTYKNEYGDIFDCVNIYHQPAFEHPLLRYYTVEQPKPELSPSKSSQVLSEQKSTHYCPKKTIPIMRSYKHDVEVDINNFVVDPPYTEYAHVRSTKRGHPIFGASAKLQHATPYVHHKTEYSIAHVMLVSNYGTSQQKSIEAGWLRTVVSKSKTFDTAPTRFYIRWTDDGYRTTGCTNLDCPGFIHTNPKIELGGALGNHDPITINIKKDSNNQNWYLYKESEMVGYWPHTIFTNLDQDFQQAIFGGEVKNTHRMGRHTHTHMGNGRYGTEVEGQAAAINQIEVLHDVEALHFTNLDEHEIHMNKPMCYNATVQNPHLLIGGFTLYYGGPGYDIENCKYDGAFANILTGRGKST